MAQASAHGDHGHGHMEIRDQRETFHGFLMATIWVCGHMAQLIALLTLAFAIGAGFWAGFAAFVVIGVAIGMVFRMSGVYWAAQVAIWVLLGLGGLIVPALAGMAG
jgi:type IV secretory pathway VirB6-like protein